MVSDMEAARSNSRTKAVIRVPLRLVIFRVKISVRPQIGLGGRLGIGLFSTHV